MARIKLTGFGAIDRRTAAAREHLALRSELANAVGGEANLTPQERKLVDLAARASLLLDHVDAWLFQQPRLVNASAKTVLPILVQRQALADHLVRLLDKLSVPEHAPSVDRAVIYIPDNHRDRHLAAGRTTNGQHSAQQSSESRSPTPRAIVELPPSRRADFISPNRDQPHDGADSDGIEPGLGLT